MYGSDSQGLFGFASVADWFTSVVGSFPAPWRIAPLEGKYYGTVILDARGAKILSIWDASGDPSDREKARFGGDWTREYCCDSHWESETAFQIAIEIIGMRGGDPYAPFEKEKEFLLLHLILHHARWGYEVRHEIACGGPMRRRVESREMSLP